MSARVLIIEDEASIRRVMTMALEPNYEVTAAEDGPLGLAKFGDGTGWDAVLLDQRMPGLEGLEVLRRIKSINTAVPVIMITAYPSIDLAVDAMKIGAVDFLRKPVTPDILRSAVQAAMGVRPVAPAGPRPERHDRPDIEMITMNGFRIVHDESDAALGRYRFTVFKGDSNAGTPVEVQITGEAMAEVERLVRQTFDRDSGMWEVLAEDYLATFLWNDQHIPTRPIVLREITADELKAANFWPSAH
jgi:CheY-like chemotaxis protein